MLKAITFDFWNTLYKPPPDLRISTKRVEVCKNILQAMGYDLTDEEVMDAIKQTWKYAYHKQREDGIDIAPRGHVDVILEKLNIRLEQQDWDKLYHVYTDVMIDLPPELNDGVLDTLPLLAHKYKLAVICNTGVTPGIILREIMRKDDIFQYFQVTVFSDEVTWAKPNPKIFDYTMKQLNVTPAIAAHIGDDRLTDVFGAKNAGLTSIWLAPQANEAIPECDYHISSVRELLELF